MTVSVVSSGEYRARNYVEKAHGKIGQGEVEIVTGGFVEDALGEGGGDFGVAARTASRRRCRAGVG